RMHAHPAHAHSHDHSADAHGLADKRYSVAIGLNLGFVAIEAAAGFYANSTALFSDAAHNLSDVLGLALSGCAPWLAQRAASDRRTYGFSKATVFAALANALVLVGVCGGILWEAILRFASPQTTQPLFVMVTAALGVVVNGATAVLFMAGRRDD